MASIQVLLATFNGGTYLEDLIRSIRSQSEVSQVSILASDDHSKDNSMEILRDSGITILESPSIGAADNFRFLITKANGYEYYAFADQDDLWHPNKISGAIEHLKDLDKPAIYVGSTIDTNGRLHVPKMYTLPESLMTNQVQGCTIVFNRKFHNLLQENLPPSFVMHDWWVYLLAQCFGEIVFDEKPCMIYRIHKGNLIGTGSKFLKALRLFGRFVSTEYYTKVAIQANYLMRIPIPGQKSREIESWLEAINGNLIDRVKYLLNVKLNFESFWKNLYFSFLILMGKYKLPPTEKRATS